PDDAVVGELRGSLRILQEWRGLLGQTGAGVVVAALGDREGGELRGGAPAAGRRGVTGLVLPTLRGRGDRGLAGGVAATVVTDGEDAADAHDEDCRSGDAEHPASGGAAATAGALPLGVHLRP